MSHSRLTTILIGGALTLSVAHAEAATIASGVDINSAYAWRGIAFNNGPVLQPWLDVGGITVAKDVSLGANVWTNVDLDDYDGALKGGEISEADFTLTLTLPKGFKAGYVEYTFPAGASGSRELFAGWSWSKSVSLALNAYYDVDENEDFFATVAVGKGVKLGEKVSLNLDALAGFAGKKFAETYGGTNGGLYNYAISGNISYAAGERAIVSATVGYAGGFDENTLPEQDVRLHAGIGMTLTF